MQNDDDRASGWSSEFDDEGSLTSGARAAADWLPSGALTGARQREWTPVVPLRWSGPTSPPPALRVDGCVIRSNNSTFASLSGF